MTEPRPAAVSRLGYALLAGIAREPLTGYALARRLRDPIGFFWEARHSQIYPELARLDAAGLIASSSGHGPGPRPKRTYALTDAGRDELRRWIGAPSQLGGRHDELLLKVYASWLVDPSVIAALVGAARTHHAAQLALYTGREASARDRGIDQLGFGDPNFADYLTLRRGVDFERGRLAWCDWVLDLLQRTGTAVPDPQSPAARRSATP